MNNNEHTPGPWRWQGEDYRGGWGWQILVGPDGEGLIIGEESDGKPSRYLRGFMPADPAVCITGLEADGKPRVNGVHVFSEANARLISASPDLLEACQRALGDCAEYAEISTPPVSGRVKKTVRIIEAAIAKATKKAIAVCALLLALAPLSANAALIHYNISSNDTANEVDGYGRIFPDELIPVELEADLDHETGFVQIYRLQAINGPTVVIDIPPHSAQLTLQSTGVDYGGDTPHGHIGFHPIGTVPHTAGLGWAFYFFPDPEVPLAMSIQTPEPQAWVMAAMGLLAIWRRRNG